MHTVLIIKLVWGFLIMFAKKYEVKMNLIKLKINILMTLFNEVFIHNEPEINFNFSLCKKQFQFEKKKNVYLYYVK